MSAAIDICGFTVLLSCLSLEVIFIRFIGLKSGVRMAQGASREEVGRVVCPGLLKDVMAETVEMSRRRHTGLSRYMNSNHTSSDPSTSLSCYL